MDADVNDFRQAAARVQQRGRSARYPQWMPVFAVEYAAEQRRNGTSFAGVARQLGISAQLLGHWLQQHRAPLLLPVRVQKESEAEAVTGAGSSVTVTTPDGYRIEGLSRE